MACKSLKQAVQELWYWQRGTEPTNFTSHLYTLMSKADLENRGLLASAFTYEFQAFVQWQSAENEDAFFKKYDR